MDLKLKSRTQKLSNPGLDNIKSALIKGLPKVFKNIEVEIVDCPDLTKEPFGLVAKGLNGSPAIFDVGGPPYLLPLVMRDKVYDIKDVVELANIKPCFMIGAGAGPWPYVGTNSEMITNVLVDEKVKNGTRVAKITDSGVNVTILPDDETRFALLANFYGSQGNPGKVLKVTCSHRHDSGDFVSAIRMSLNDEFKNSYVGLGGVFLIEEGKVKQHVMPDFSKIPLHSDKELNEWLTFHEMSAPLVALGTIVSQDILDFDLRVQHFHSFGKTEGGHYHQDTTPNHVKYVGYFQIADLLYRIDQPSITHKVGRD